MKNTRRTFQRRQASPLQWTSSPLIVDRLIIKTNYIYCQRRTHSQDKTCHHGNLSKEEKFYSVAFIIVLDDVPGNMFETSPKIETTLRREFQFSLMRVTLSLLTIKLFCSKKIVSNDRVCDFIAYTPK